MDDMIIHILLVMLSTTKNMSAQLSAGLHFITIDFSKSKRTAVTDGGKERESIQMLKWEK